MNHEPRDAGSGDALRSRFARSLAVIIGIDGYTNCIPPLTTAANDAARLAKLLRAKHGYETLLLTGQEAGPAVTGPGLRALFNEELPARLGEDDRLLVYFAGHGIALDGDDGPAGYLIPQDARANDRSTFQRPASGDIVMRVTGGGSTAIKA